MDCIPSESDDSCGTGAGRVDPASVKIERAGQAKKEAGRNHEKNCVNKIVIISSYFTTILICIKIIAFNLSI